MSDAGTIWQNTPNHSPLWWLAAEILQDAMCDAMLVIPDGTDPREYAAKQWPDLHAHWMRRIRQYGPRSLSTELERENAALRAELNRLKAQNQQDREAR